MVSYVETFVDVCVTGRWRCPSTCCVPSASTAPRATVSADTISFLIIRLGSVHSFNLSSTCGDSVVRYYLMTLYKWMDWASELVDVDSRAIMCRCLWTQGSSRMMGAVTRSGRPSGSAAAR